MDRDANDKVAAKQKLTGYARIKGLLTDADFQREDATEFWARLEASRPAAAPPIVVDIHDSEPRDSIFGWDWDMVDGYVVTDVDPTDEIWHPA